MSCLPSLGITRGIIFLVIHLLIKLFVVCTFAVYHLSVLELVDVCSEDDKQPDGMSLILWWRGLGFHLALTLAPLLQFVGQGGWWIRSSKAQKRKSTIVFYFAPVCV